MAERVSAAVARNIVRAKAKKLPFEPAAKMVHVHEACGGRGCEVCDEQGAWLVAIGVDTSPAKRRGAGERPPVSDDARREGVLEALALRPCIN